jgi:hypothetical protein
MFISSCSPAANVLTVLFYPLIDYNFYKMAHGAVNLVLHTMLVRTKQYHSENLPN